MLFLKDLQVSLRSLWRRPKYAFLAVFYLTLGLAANIAIFSIIKSVLLDPLPYAHTERLYVMFDKFDRDGTVIDVPVAAWTFNQRRERVTQFDFLVGYQDQPMLIGSRRSRTVNAAAVTADFFPELGVQIWRGRHISIDEDRPGGDPVVVLNHDFWLEEFGGEEAIGKILNINRQNHTVIGILEPGFQDPLSNARFWIPLQPDPEDSTMPQRVGDGVTAIGRLAEDTTLERANAELASIGLELAMLFPDTHEKITAQVYLLKRYLTGDIRPQLLAMQVASLFVLLIACANLSCLLLLRSGEKTREMALRAVFGASRWQLARLWLNEGLLISSAAGVLGMLCATLLLRVLPDLSSLVRFSTSLQQVDIDLAVVAFAMALVIVVALVFGLLPTVRRASFKLTRDLGSGQRVGTGRERRRFLDGLVAVEVALALVLLIGTVLMLMSFWRLSTTETGFKTEDVLSLSLRLPPELYPNSARRLSFLNAIEERVETLPSVREAGWTSNRPLDGPPTYRTLTIRNRVPISTSELLFAASALVTEDFFSTMGIPLIAGRGFEITDHLQSNSVVIVSQSMAERFWPGESPLGKQLKRGALPRPETPWSTVIGVVGDIKFESLRVAQEPAFYFPFAQQAEMPDRPLFLMVQHELGVEDLEADIVRIVQEVDREAELGAFTTLTELGQATFFRHRIITWLISGAGLCALLLAILGIYGVMSYTVSQREHEMAVRLALGAEPGDLRGLVLGWGFALTLIGLLAGCLGAGLLTRFLENQLYQVKALDPIIFLATALLLMPVAILACWIPASRASRTQPIEALRHQ